MLHPTIPYRTWRRRRSTSQAPAYLAYLANNSNIISSVPVGFWHLHKTILLTEAMLLHVHICVTIILMTGYQLQGQETTEIISIWKLVNRGTLWLVAYLCLTCTLTCLLTEDIAFMLIFSCETIWSLHYTCNRSEVKYKTGWIKWRTNWCRMWMSNNGIKHGISCQCHAVFVRLSMCVSVCLSIYVHSVKVNKHIFKICLPSVSQAILVFPCLTAWQ